MKQELRFVLSCMTLVNLVVAGGVTILRGEARRGFQRVPLQLIPYFAWANRGVTEMTVWFARNVE